MENLITRYRNVTILVAMLFVQVLGLAVQVKRGGGDEPTRLIRLWTVSAVTPLEKVIVWGESGLGNLWNNYVYLRGVRQENRDLKFEIEQLRLQQVRLADDAQQARRLQALLGFKEQYIAKTVAAQVIGSSGSEQSRSIFIDKGSNDGVEKDMAVITADGVVGKVLLAFGSTVAGAHDQRSAAAGWASSWTNRACREWLRARRRRGDPGKCDDRRSGGSRGTGGDQRRRPDLSQGPYRRHGDEGFSGSGSFSQYPGKAERQPEPAGRSSGDHEEGGSGAVGGRDWHRCARWIF